MSQDIATSTALIIQAEQEERDALLTVEDVARRWAVHEKTIRKWNASGLLPCVRIGCGCASSSGIRPLVRFRWSVVLSFERDQLQSTD
jgi:hypothetical protein